ncbi:hypothetical protein [Pseudonocardia sp. N23]|uniref:hypothetical protein n=1 Tax=Pseudonocardia sp. N23 TaxID=1987376 RepID=UPI0011456953|nr:hypothetical protein [Pseudonocardia sp. N23]
MTATYRDSPEQFTGCHAGRGTPSPHVVDHALAQPARAQELRRNRGPRALVPVVLRDEAREVPLEDAGPGDQHDVAALVHQLSASLGAVDLAPHTQPDALARQLREHAEHGPPAERPVLDDLAGTPQRQVQVADHLLVEDLGGDVTQLVEQQPAAFDRIQPKAPWIEMSSSPAVSARFAAVMSS